MHQNSRWFIYDRSITQLNVYLPKGTSTHHSLKYVQFPISDEHHGPYNYCIGRFETYFNPTHPDPLTPGRRTRTSFCQNLSGISGFLMELSCKTSVIIFLSSTLCIPESLLYMVSYLSGFVWSQMHRLVPFVDNHGKTQIQSTMALRQQ